MALRIELDCVRAICVVHCVSFIMYIENGVMHLRVV